MENVENEEEVFGNDRRSNKRMITTFERTQYGTPPHMTETKGKPLMMEVLMQNMRKQTTLTNKESAGGGRQKNLREDDGGSVQSILCKTCNQFKQIGICSRCRISKLTCHACLNTCAACAQTFCADCCFTDYSQRENRIFCFNCKR